MPQTTSSLLEIREADAPPHIAAIYADIRQSAALPLVNLIFRHFACHPGVLEWVWATLRPLYRSQELADAAAALSQSIERPGPSPLMAALDGNDLAACRTVIESYNSGNPQNLIGLTALIRALGQEGGGTRPAQAEVKLTPRSFANDYAAAAFPAMPRRDGLDDHCKALLGKLGRRHRTAPGVTPSLYVHLALWPAALEAADIYLEPVIESPGWPALVDSIIQQAAGTADGLAPAIVMAEGRPSAETLDPVIATVETFINNTIPEMVTVGRLLAIG